MAKKKQKQQLSPKKYIVSKARTLPIYKTFINPDWKSSGIATIIVLREHKSGYITFGSYLVDLYCKGVKGTAWFFNKPKSEILEYVDELDLEECTYQLAHNIIFESLTFAEECGFTPDSEFAITEFILEDDEEGHIEDLEIHCGNEDGVPFLIEQDFKQFKKDYITLEKTLGEGNFKYLSGVDEDDEDEDEDEDDDEFFSDSHYSDMLYPILMYKAIRPEAEKSNVNYLTNILVDSNLSFKDFIFDYSDFRDELYAFYEYEDEKDVNLGLDKLIQKDLTQLEVLVLFDELIKQGNVSLLTNLHQKYKSNPEYDDITTLIYPFTQDVEFLDAFDPTVFKEQVTQVPKNNALALIIYLIKKAFSIVEYQNVQEKEDIIFTISNLAGPVFALGILNILKGELYVLKEGFVEEHHASLSSEEFEELTKLFENEVRIMDNEINMLTAD